jgi:hypothetical protein
MEYFCIFMDSNVIHLSLFEFRLKVWAIFSLWRASMYPLFSLFGGHQSTHCFSLFFLFGSCFFGMASFISHIFA